MTAKDVNEYEEFVCPGCGLAVEKWPNPQGFLSDTGEYYCCADCAAGKLCECSGEIRESTRETQGGFERDAPKSKGA